MKIDKTTVKSLSDREIQEAEHDLMVDITHDLSLSADLHNKYDLVNKERKIRNLKKLKPLNGTISW